MIRFLVGFALGWFAAAAFRKARRALARRRAARAIRARGRSAWDFAEDDILHEFAEFLGPQGGVR